MSRKKTNDDIFKRKSPPPSTPEAKENELISLTVDLVEQQLRDGTATSQVITHFLKLATEKASLEKEKLARENELLKAKTETLQSQKRIEELYSNALDAMRLYSGQDINVERYSDEDL